MEESTTSLLSKFVLLIIGWHLAAHSISRYYEERIFSPRFHACTLLCYIKACTMKGTTSKSQGSWQKGPVLPFVSRSAAQLHYSCACQSASMCSCLVSRGFPPLSPIFSRISSTAFSKAALSCSRVTIDCFSLPSLLSKSSTVASRFWIFPLATFQRKKRVGRGRRGRKKKKMNW